MKFWVAVGWRAQQAEEIWNLSHSDMYRKDVFSKDITNLKYSKITVVNIQIKVNSSVNSGQARTMFKRFLLEQGNMLQKIPSWQD